MAGPDLLLRPMLAADLPEMSDLWVETWADTLPQIDFEARRPWFVDHVAALRAAGVAVTVAFDRRDGSMAGFVTVAPDGHLDTLAVARAQRGSGAARVLVDHAKASSPAGLRLEVNVDNPRAVRFYEREGFVRTGEGVSPRSGLPLLFCAWPGPLTPPPGR